MRQPAAGAVGRSAKIRIRFRNHHAARPFVAAALQRDACVTAGAVIGPADPRDQLGLCTGFHGADALSCIHGTKVQNLIGYSNERFFELIARCEIFAPRVKRGCYEWLGKTIAVVTDGEFTRNGCPELATPEAERACLAGARSSDDALVTFS